MVVAGIVPCASGESFAVSGASSVGPFQFVGCDSGSLAVVVCEAVELAVVRSVDEYREAARVVAQHKVGATSHDDARLFCGEFAYKFALYGEKSFRCGCPALYGAGEVFFEEFAYVVRWSCLFGLLHKVGL